jgi:hypothetical protein
LKEKQGKAGEEQKENERKRKTVVESENETKMIRKKGEKIHKRKNKRRQK